MSDTEDDGFTEEAFKSFGEDPAPVAPPAPDPVAPPVDPPKADPKPAEEPKKNEAPVKTPEETPPAPTDDKKAEETPKPAEAPEAPTAPEAPQPLTKDDVKSVVSDLLNSERSSGKELESATKDVMDAYYPDGLSNVLVTPEGKELKTPQDVVDASNGKMSTDEAAQWLLNEQFKLDKQLTEIRDSAKQIAETTVNFKHDAVAAVAKYEPLFKAYPYLQQKVYDKLMKQVKVDKDKNVILSSPDVMEHYDDYLEPYQLAFEHSTQTSATNPTPPADEKPVTPSAEDRMDESGDGGASADTDDPNDFAQQVKKELAGGL